MRTDETKSNVNMNTAESSFSGIDHNVAYWGFSQRGESHNQNGSPCQDCCIARSVRNTSFLIVAMADGLGSCALSHYGASFSVHSAVDFLEDSLAQICRPVEDAYMGELLRAAMQHAYDEVKNMAKDMGQLEYAFQSTLTLAVYDGDTLYISHVGDGGIIVLTEDGILELVTARLKGDEASSVYPLQAGSDFWQVLKVDRRVNAFIMATDGVLDAFVGGPREANRIYYPFIEPALTYAGTDLEAVRKIQQFYYQYMAGEKYRKIVTDDLTLIVVTNLDRFSENKFPDFNRDEWDRKTEDYQKELDMLLYMEKRNTEKTKQEQKSISEGQGVRNIEQQAVSTSASAKQIKVPGFVNDRNNFPPVIQQENSEPIPDGSYPQTDNDTAPVSSNLSRILEICRKLWTLLFDRNIFLIICLVIIIIIILLHGLRLKVPLITIMTFSDY